MSEPISFGARLRQLAVEQGDATALTVVSQGRARTSVTYAELDAWSESVAVELQQRGVSAPSMVIVAVGNSVEHFVVTFAAWKLGALLLPLNKRMPSRERDAMLELAGPTAVISDWDDVPGLTSAEVRALRDRRVDPLPDATPYPGKCVGSGGSTGRPKIIVDPGPLARVPGASLGSTGDTIGFHKSSVQLVPGPVYHNMPFTWSVFGLFEGQHVIVMERFDAAMFVDLVEQERVEFVTLVPTMMRRVAELPGVQDRDFSSLRGVLHSAAPCPEPLKRAWIDLVGAEVLWEGFGATENVGITLIRGDEWLDRPGSVGRPYGSLVKVVDDSGNELAAGEVGEVFMKQQVEGEYYRYVGAPPARTDGDGFVSVGDMGWLDADGYLYPADRRLDLIISGGANIYPAEVEAVLLEHPAVSDAVVIGLPDEHWGKRVHAIVEPYAGGTAESADLDKWCRASLAPYKVPKTYEVVTELPRDEAGKIRRRALADERAS